MNIVPLALLMGTLVMPIEPIKALTLENAEETYLLHPRYQIEMAQNNTTSSIDEVDLRLMASIIYAEAGNQCLAGQQAVGIIIMNRSESENFATGIYDVIYQTGQFAPVRNGSLNKALKLYDDNNIPTSCVEAAEYALLGNKNVAYNDTVIDLSDYYFFSRKLSGARITIQDHQFK